MSRSAKWAENLKKKHRFKVTYGGRGGGKTVAKSKALVQKMVRESLRICVCRGFKNAIGESLKAAIVAQINELGYEEYFEVLEEEINCKVTGAHMFFRGLTRNTSSIRGLESVDIVWIDEAQYIGTEAWDTLVLTIRKPGSEIWVSFNPTYATDVVWTEFCANEPPANTWLFKINYTENPFISDEFKADAERYRRLYPERYAHHFLGELDEVTGDVNRVLPMNFIDATMREPEYDWRGEPVRAGFDVADEGDDQSAFVARQGPVVIHMETFPDDVEGSCKKVYELCQELGVKDLWYDATGLGTGVRDRFRAKMPCKNVVGVSFGGAVLGKKTDFEQNQKNESVFALRNAQLAWNVHMRGEQARRQLIDVEAKIDERKCLYILPGVITPQFRAQLAQPIWDRNLAGKIRVHKKPKGVYTSPDIYDGTVLCFAHDIRNGLKSGGRHIIQDGSDRQRGSAVRVL